MNSQRKWGFSDIKFGEISRYKLIIDRLCGHIINAPLDWISLLHWPDRLIVIDFVGGEEKIGIHTICGGEWKVVGVIEIKLNIVLVVGVDDGVDIVEVELECLIGSDEASYLSCCGTSLIVGSGRWSCASNNPKLIILKHVRWKFALQLHYSAIRRT